MTNDIIVEAEAGSTVWETAKSAYDMFNHTTCGKIMIRHNLTVYEVKLDVRAIGQMELKEVKKGVVNE